MIAAMALPAVSTQNMLRWMLFGVLAMGMLSLNSGSGTLAYFTTQVQSNNNTFTAGNLRFNILDSINTTGQYPSIGSSLSLPTMKPGDTLYAPIQLNNVGNIAAKYGIKYATTTSLATNSNSSIGTVSAPTTTKLMDSGRTTVAAPNGNGLAFSPAIVAGTYVMITGGAGLPLINKITSVTAPDTLNVLTAWATTVDTTTSYSVVNFAGTVGSSTATTLTDGTAAWTVNQWVGYTITSGTNTGKILSNTATVLTVSPAFAPGTPAAAAIYSISPTNLAPALNLGIVGRGAGTGTATTGLGGNNCNAINYAAAGVFAETAVGAGSPAKAVGLMAAIGATLSSAATGTPMIALTGTDVLCIQVGWPDGGLPGSPTTGDNIYNGATAGAYSTNLNFTFDGQ
jgi:predicted ribosomally synthesized peptide with SipW-like signal peptide